MKQLPSKFTSWNKFFNDFKSSPHWVEDAKIIVYNEQRFTVEEIKAYCFDELRAVIPDMGTLSRSRVRVAQGNNLTPEEDLDKWLSDIMSIL